MELMLPWLLDPASPNPDDEQTSRFQLNQSYAVPSKEIRLRITPGGYSARASRRAAGCRNPAPIITQSRRWKQRLTDGRAGRKGANEYFSREFEWLRRMP
jgi:hypothetical protein